MCQRIHFTRIIYKQFNFCSFRASAYTNVSRLCAVYLYNSWLVTWLYCIFLGHAPRSNPWMDFHGLWLIRRVSTQGRLLGVATISEFIWGNSPRKLPKKGVNRPFQAKRAEYKNRDILHGINTINMQF